MPLPFPRTRPHRTTLGVFLVLLLAAAVVAPASAQETAPVERAASARVEALSSDLNDARRDHLWRVAAWGGVNVAGGLALVLASGRDERGARWAFGAMSAGWGAVNVGIAAVGLATAPTEAATAYGAALSAERNFHDILLLNLGLNVAYAGVGGTMLAAGYRDVSNAAEWRGFGTSLILQGAGLLVLDGVAFLASRTRLADLVGLAGDLSATALPTGFRLALRF
jgi:hypothetical protein